MFTSSHWRWGADSAFGVGAEAVDPADRIGRSPRPEEPDTHIRFVWGSEVFDYCGCRTAVGNFLGKWAQCHNPAVTAVEVFDGHLPATRMPCEELWLQP